MSCLDHGADDSSGTALDGAGIGYPFLQVLNLDSLPAARPLCSSGLVEIGLGWCDGLLWWVWEYPARVLIVLSPVLPLNVSALFGGAEEFHRIT